MQPREGIRPTWSVTGDRAFLSGPTTAGTRLLSGSIIKAAVQVPGHNSPWGRKSVNLSTSPFTCFSPALGTGS